MVYKAFFDELEVIEQAAVEEESDTKYAFNIFSILRKYDDEVGLHSKFLAELLNSTGSHGIDNFQKLFIDKVLNAAVDAQEWTRAPLCSSNPYVCQIEVPIKNFGRVDIVLKNHDTIIVIENKIHAFDQKDQLQRYFEACTKMGYNPENIYILYLNKDGSPVTDYGKGNLQEDQFGQINYRDDITSWLDLCIAEVDNYQHIQQVLLQYRRLVGSLTGDNRSSKMKKAHVELLYQKDNFKLAHELSKSFVGFQIDLQKKVWEELKIALESKGYDFSFCDKNLQVCDQNKIIKRYYKVQKPSRHYGIQCKIGSLDYYEIHCFVQLYHNIYYGMTTSENGVRIEYPNKLDDLAARIDSLDVQVPNNGKKWFLGGNIKPNKPIKFIEVSDLYQIANSDARKSWIEQTANEIVSFIENVKSLGLIEVQ